MQEDLHFLIPMTCTTKSVGSGPWSLWMSLEGSRLIDERGRAQAKFPHQDASERIALPGQWRPEVMLTTVRLDDGRRAAFEVDTDALRMLSQYVDSSLAFADPGQLHRMARRGWGLRLLGALVVGLGLLVAFAAVVTMFGGRMGSGMWVLVQGGGLALSGAALYTKGAMLFAKAERGQQRARELFGM